MSSWDNDTEMILNSICINANELSEFHKEKYYYYKNMLKYFKIPIIILSSINSVIAIGLSAFIEQSIVSIITCILSLISAMLGSIELYLGIQKTMETELDSSKQFKILSYEIYKNLSLKRENRNVNGKTYLEEKYNEFIKLIEQSTLTDKKVNDLLVPKLEKLKKNKLSLEGLNDLMTTLHDNSSNSSLTSDNLTPKHNIEIV